MDTECGLGKLQFPEYREIIPARFGHLRQTYMLEFVVLYYLQLTEN